jgi:glutamine amidotransferase
MGWNFVKPAYKTPFFGGFDQLPRFYFVHSYHVCCENPEDVLSTSLYGYEFTSAVKRGNIIGTQFHPEKSHKYGMQLMQNFVNMDFRTV